MDKKGKISARMAWLMVLASLIDDVVVLALIFIVLWLFDVAITWWLIVIVVVAMVAFIMVMHRAVVPALRRRVVNGLEGMVGLTGNVTESCQPMGIVKIKGEFWKAKAAEDALKAGEEVEVVGITGLILEVRKKKREL
jgi:membrane-bound serine protease (ClpP class)